MSGTERATFPIVVHTMLVRQGRWFLLRRANSGFLDGAYTLPGGHVRVDEGVVAAALRECREEAGVDVAPGDLVLVAAMPYRSVGAARHTALLDGVNFIARVERFSGEPHIAEPDRFDRCCWADPAALPEPPAPYLVPLRELLAADGWFRELGVTPG